MLSSPFISILGYDVFNPMKLFLNLRDVGTKKGDKG